MKVPRSFFTVSVPSFIFISLLFLGIPVSGFSAEPHVCIGNQISTNWQNLGNVDTFTFVWAVNCGAHTSNTNWWKFKVINANNGTTLCEATNNGNGWTAGSGGEATHSLPCPTSGTLPKGLTAKITAIVDYTVIGSNGPMSHNDNFLNK